MTRAVAAVVLLGASLLYGQAEVPALPEQVRRAFDQVAAQRAAENGEGALNAARRAVDLAGTIDGLPHTTLARLLDEVGMCEFLLGRYPDAERSFRKALQMRESTGALTDRGIAWSLNGLAMSLLVQGKASDADSLIKRALSLLDHDPSTPPEDLLPVLGTRAQVAVALGHDDDFNAALQQVNDLTKKMIESIRGVAPAPQPAADPADEMMTQNLAMMNALDSAAMPVEMRLLARMFQAFTAESSNDVATAERTYCDGADLALHAPGDGAAIGCACNAWGGFARRQQRPEEAETLYRRALAVFRHDPAFALDAAFAHLGLARIAAAAHESRDARAHYEEAIAAFQATLTENHPFVASTELELAQFPEAGLADDRRMTLIRAARRIFDATAPFPQLRGVPPQLRARSLEDTLRMQEALDCATRLYQQALERGSVALGAPALSDSLGQSADTYRLYGGFTQAVSALRRVISERRIHLGDDYALAVPDLQRLADSERAAGMPADAVAHAREATARLDHRVAAYGDPRAELEARVFQRGVYVTHLEALFAGSSAGLHDGNTADSFVVAQKAHASATALTLQAAAARFAARDSHVRAVLRRFEDLGDRRRAIDQDLLLASGASSGARDLAHEAYLRDELGRIDGSLRDLRSELERRYPAFADFIAPRPVSLAAVQRKLAPTEALLVFVIGPRMSFAWLVRRDGAEAAPIEIGVADLAADIRALRESLEPDSILAQRAAGRTDLSFDVARAFKLYRELLQPFGDWLKGMTNVIVVPDGPLDALPLGVLVTDAPRPGESLQEVHWLGEQIATSVLPSVSAYLALRPAHRVSSHARRAFIGFASGGSAIASPSLAQSEPEMQLARMRALRRSSDLRETRAELAAIAAAVGGSREEIRLADRATKQALLQTRLDAYRVLSFSTHAVIGREAADGEPALLFAPSADGTASRLAAHEIAALTLDADTVLLLGCNTAASDGTPDAEGLSGLARAFFRAGSRSLIVSHWSIPSEATVVLMTELFAQTRAHPQAGMSECLRRAVRAFVTEPGHPERAHPAFWGAFILVGDGRAPLIRGRARRETPGS